MAKTAKAELKLIARTRPRVLRGHPWVYANEVQQTLPREFDGKAIPLRDARGRQLGVGIYNSQSQICWRRLKPRGKGADFDARYLRETVSAAIALREKRVPGHFRRLVASDADYVPGLVVDQFGGVLLVQGLTKAVDLRMQTITTILRELLDPEEIIYRNDSPVRALEGLKEEVGTYSGLPYAARWFQVDGIEYFLDLGSPGKARFHLEQRSQHTRVASYARGRIVLDAFCNLGSFGLQCAEAGAQKVIAVDLAEEAIKLTRLNAGKNQLAIQATRGDVFTYFNGLKKKDLFDLIVLSPPSFARNRKAVANAVRNYKDMNLKGLKALSPGGILATYSCSPYIDGPTFENVVHEAAILAKRNLRILETVEQPLDHPVLLNLAESRFLRGYILEVA